MLMEDDQAASGTAGVDAALASCGKTFFGQEAGPNDKLHSR